MDRLVHTALNSVGNLRDARVAQAQNLANLNVPGFRRDLASSGTAAFVISEAGQGARAVQIERGPQLFSGRSGPMQETGDPMHLAIDGEGWFLVQPDGGAPALSRRGDLTLDAQGRLVNGEGDALLGTDGAPLRPPPFSRIEIDDLGQIRIQPRAGGPMVAAGMLATTLAAGADLAKGPDGRIRAFDGTVPPADQGARLRQGVLEGSNVDAVTEMVEMIDLQRSFELTLRLVGTARDLDEGTARLMRLPD